jgi:hypothetical protein
MTENKAIQLIDKLISKQLSKEQSNKWQLFSTLEAISIIIEEIDNYENISMPEPIHDNFLAHDFEATAKILQMRKEKLKEKAK